MSDIADEKSSTPPPAAKAVLRPAPTRRSTLDFFNAANASDKFWRMFSSREKVIENLKTLVWVVPITLVIWIYAEREQVVSPNVTGIPARITSSDPNLYVEVIGDPNPIINLKLTGPQQAIERVRERLTSGIPRGLPTIDLGSSLGIGPGQQVNIVEHIQNMEVFRSTGVTVQEAQPSTIYVNIDKLAHRDLPVEIPPGVNNLTIDTHFVPAKIMVSGPETVLKRLTENGDLKAFANLADNASLKTQGHHVLSAVPVTLSPLQDKLRVDPGQVTADIVVRAADVSYTIQNMPITVDAAPSTWHNFDLVVTNGESITIDVTGSQEQIDAIKNKTVTPKAILEIVPDDSSPTASPSKKLTFIMPPGVKVDPKDMDRTVDFKLTRRDNSGT